VKTSVTFSEPEQSLQYWQDFKREQRFFHRQGLSLLTQEFAVETGCKYLGQKELKFKYT